MSVFPNKPNRQTWDRVLSGDVTAYQVIVESHQSAVSAVAYSIIGDFPISQDIAQETFWVAWTKRNSLRDAKKLGSWLCGIARNLAKQWRKKHKRVAKTSGGDLPYEPAAEGLDPAQQSIADEEQQVVWSALEQIPENFREVLTLYYRQGQSIAEVADSLDITDDAARQRLSRGRTMLRGRVSQLIEGVLVRTKPDKSFVAKVMAGLAGASVAAKAGTAAASSISVAKAAGGATAGVAAAKGVLATGASVGVLGGILGGIGGLAGGWLGTWLPAQLAPTETERQLLMQQGRVTMGLGIVFTIGILVLALAYSFIGFNPWLYAAALLGLMLAFLVPLIVQATRLSRLAKELRKNIDSKSDPNQSHLAGYGKKLGIGKVRKGRSYTSELKLFGIPILDVQFSDADFGGNPIDRSKKKHARGWIAFGDIASGFLALGGFARGLIAFGGMTCGVISLGGISTGLFSFGGLAMGYIAIGGGAIGYDAMGGAAVGWHSAAGGAAVSGHVAAGGAAVARDYAVGGAAIANEVNTLAAERMADKESFMPWIEWGIQNPAWFYSAIAGFSLLVILNAIIMVKFVYTNEDESKIKTLQ